MRGKGSSYQQTADSPSHAFGSLQNGVSSSLPLTASQVADFPISLVTKKMNLFISKSYLGGIRNKEKPKVEEMNYH